MRYIAYYRVSTDKQGESKLGLDAQKTIVKNFLNPIKGKLIREYIEVESGRKTDRKELNKAIADCKTNEATLVIAKLDRLSRNVRFLFELRESNLNFVACDIPELNTLSLGMYATFAQYEAERISQRTKDALAEIRKKGIKLGAPEKTLENARMLALKKRRDNSKSKMEDAYNFAKKLLNSTRQQHSIRDIARRLNENGYTSPRGKKFTPTTVKNMLAMLER